MNDKFQYKVSLQVKVVAMAIVSVTLLAMLLVYFYGREMERAKYDALSKRAAAIATGLANECEYGLMAGNKTLLQQAVVKVLAQSDVTAAVVYDETGKAMAAAGRVDNADGVKLVQSHRQPAFVGSPPGEGERLAEFYMPVLLQPTSILLDAETDAATPQIGQPLGLIALTISQASTDLAVHQAQRTAAVLTGLSALAVSLLALLAVRRMTQPLRKLVAGTEELADGNLGARVSVTSSDEIGELARSFNNMATTLQQSQAEVLSYQRDLEQRVAARTAALQESNRQLQEAEAKYRTLVEQLPGITYIAEIGMDGRWLYVSPQVESLLGFSAAEWMAEPTRWAKQIHPDDLETVRAGKTRLAAEGGTFYGDYRILARDGHIVWFRDLAVAIHDATGQPRRLQGVLLDITDAKQTEAKFLQAQKVEAIGQLAGGVAHDFNNILTAITGYSELTLRRLAVSDPLYLNLQEIHKAADRAAGLTRQLLAFSRKQTLQPKVIDLNTVLVDMDKMLRRLIGEHIDLATLSGRDLGRVKADPAQIEQIIINLSVNARDAMPYGGSLTVETDNVTLDTRYARTHNDVTPGRYVMLAVSDTGVGMTNEVKAHLFEPFYTTKGVGKGTGLGLATCYGIIKQSGGHIAVYSEPGRGTTFKVYLPFVDAEADALKPTTPDAPAAGGQETVLLVEDEPAVREMAALVLGELGYRVVAASNGVEALDVVAQRTGDDFDLLVTDVVMPQMGGKELADQLSVSRPNVKVLFTSGYTEDAIVHHGVLEPGIAFLQKPYTTAALARKVRSVLDVVVPGRN